MQEQEISENGCGQIQEAGLPLDQAMERSKKAMTLDDHAFKKLAAEQSVVPGEEAHEYLTGLKLALVMSAVTMVAFLILLDSAIIATVSQPFYQALWAVATCSELKSHKAIPKITSEFHSIPDIGWYASAYLLANCSLQPLSGKLYTHFSSKYIFLAFFAVFELGSLLCGVSVLSNMLIVGRAVAGMGGSGLTNGALTIITASVPLKKRPAFLGSLMSIAQIGTIRGPLIGGALTQYTTWRWCRFPSPVLVKQSLTVCAGFYINLPAGAIVAALLLAIRIPDRVVKQDKKSTLGQNLDRLDLSGAALFASMIVMVLLALQWGGQTHAWVSATILGLFGGAIGNLAIFLYWEAHRGSTAMIPLAMLGKRVVYSSCLTTFFQMGNQIVTTYYLALWFQIVKGATPTLSGVYLLPSVLSQMVFAIFSGVVGKPFLPCDTDDSML